MKGHRVGWGDLGRGHGDRVGTRPKEGTHKDGGGGRFMGELGGWERG